MDKVRRRARATDDFAGKFQRAAKVGQCRLTPGRPQVDRQVDSQVDPWSTAS
jgi:hypothetical protein